MRGGGKLTKPLTTSASPRYLYGTPEEIAGRLEDEHPATESHFTQIRPSQNPSPRGRSLDERNKGQGVHGPVSGTGRLGKGLARGE